MQRCAWQPSRARVLLFAVNPPTSVEAERAFSSAGLLCTKIRSRRVSVTRHWILCASCAAIIASASNLAALTFALLLYCT